uniref:Regulator of G protein signaling 18 n=1 Tax=Laticauda laticaudata TaxID=8630 RepID=A0A8C5RF47_LATLA
HLGFVLKLDVFQLKTAFTFLKLSSDSSENFSYLFKMNFHTFLRSEFSEENIEFWMACEEYRKSKDAMQLPLKAKTIYETFIERESPKEVNLDFNTKVSVNQNMVHPTHNTFDAAQNKIYALMEQDSYPRFLKSNLYLDLLHSQRFVSYPGSTVDNLLQTLHTHVL